MINFTLQQGEAPHCMLATSGYGYVSCCRKSSQMQSSSITYIMSFAVVRIQTAMQDHHASTLSPVALFTLTMRLYCPVVCSLHCRLFARQLQTQRAFLSTILAARSFYKLYMFHVG